MMPRPQWSASVVAVALAVTGATLVAGQSSTAGSKAKTPPSSRPAPRTSWGAPDLQGIWDFRSLTPLERPKELANKDVFTNQEAETFAEQTIRRQSRDSDTSGRVVPYNDFWFDEGTKVTTQRTSLIVDPPDGRMPPLTPAAEKQRAAQREARRGIVNDVPRPGAWVEDINPSVRCIVGFNSGPPMRPSAYNNNFQLFQTPGYVVLLNEMVHDARIVPLDTRPHVPQQVRQWMGDSRGRWEGDTLVIDTTNFRSERTPFGASAAARLVERFTRADADTLTYEVTVDDPATWTKPWTFRVPMAKTPDLMYEYACHEGNYGLYGILAGVSQTQETTKESPK